MSWYCECCIHVLFLCMAYVYGVVMWCSHVDHLCCVDVVLL